MPASSSKTASWLLAACCLAFSGNASAQAPAPAPVSVAVDTASAGPFAVHLLDALGRRVVPDASLRTGAVTDELVSELLAVVCGRSDAPRYLPKTCAPLAGRDTLIELRRRLVSDALGFPFRSYRVELGRIEPEQRVALALLMTAAQGDLDALAGALLGSGPNAELARLRFSSPAEIVRAIQGRRLDEVERAALLLRVLETEIRRGTRDPAALEQALLLTLPPVAGVEVERLSAEARAASKRLVVAYAGLRREFELAGSAVEPLVVLNRIADIGADALAITLSRRVPIEAVKANLAALFSGQIVASLAPFLVRREALSASAAQSLVALERAERFLRAPDDGARFRVLRGTALGLGSFADHVHADARIGAMAIAGGDYRLAANLELGYHDVSFGIGARGSVRTFQTTTDTTFEDLDRYEGAIEVFYATHPDSALRFDGRLYAGGLVYDSNRFLSDAQYDETSSFGRGALLAGLRYESALATLGLWAGGGAQYEIYDSLDFATLESDRQSTLRANFSARFQGRYAVLPSFLALRVNADANYFSITRQRLLEDLGGGEVEAERTVFRQLDLDARANLDLELLSFFGFVPGISFSVDYFRRSAEGESETAFAPVFQAGVHRYRF